MIAAWVDGLPLDGALVDAELAERYRGPAGPTLPTPGTAEGRQLRRWVVQALVVRAILATEALRRGLTPSGPPSYVDRLALGSVAAAALAGSPHGAGVFAAVTAGVTVTAAEEATFRAANPELAERAGEEVRLIRHLRAGRPVNGGRPYRIRRDDPHGALLFAARPGAVVTAGPDRFTVVAAEPAATPDLTATLLTAARSRAFARWLDLQLRDRVVLAPGSEHPGDPTQPDHTHRH
ncbi:DUF7158 domain-containing protein [Dactylosporangium sp. CA-092794]|uniref:DUF7158 domain-containing protein n=1 Tax=Dactylosporangium sp. CA-092794 TaxID=3239929 RepID=UPI003D8DC5FD